MDIARSIKQVAKAAIPDGMLLKRRMRLALADGHELSAVLKLSNGGVFIDVGANVGAWSAVAAGAFRQVQAFEPNSALATMIRPLLPKNVIVHNVALSDEDGTATLFVPLIDGLAIAARASLEAGANGAAKTFPQQVNKRTIDSYAFSQVDVIKIDVEGHEASVLRGAEATLRRERPALVVEIEERHHEGGSEAIIGWVGAQGYACFFYADENIVRFDSGDIVRLQQTRQSKVGKRAKGYINNFIFLPRENSGLLSRLQRALPKR